MKTHWKVRPAQASDAARISEIYNEGIADGQATLETVPRTAEQILVLMSDPAHRLFVAEWGDTVFGWGSILPYNDRPSDAGVGEASVYISRSARHQGIGRLLLQALVQGAQERGYHKLVGRLIASNEPSRLLCRALGFREVGVHEKHGRMGGRWVDLVLVERLIPSNL